MKSRPAMSKHVQQTLAMVLTKRRVDQRALEWTSIPSRLMKALPIHTKLKEYHNLVGHVLRTDTNRRPVGLSAARIYDHNVIELPLY